MKLRTSFFNTTVLKKDITRFAPVWGLYAVFTLLFVMLAWETESSAARFVCIAPEIFLAMGIVNFFYAPLAAFLLFGDLFKSRMCNALHALPMRREGWFFTHLSAGMLFCVAPNGVAALLTAGLLQEYAWVAFLWLALMVLQYLFFFGVAAFSVQCAGNSLGAIAVYAIVNFLAVIAGWLVVTFYEPLLYGVQLNFEDFANASPVVKFCSVNYLDFQYDNMTEIAIFEGFIGADWRYLGIAAGVGVALLAAALLIYRKRQLESAGDLIAFRPAAPVFLVIYALCVGAVLYAIADLSAPVLRYIFLFIGLAIGFFTGRMLLERKLRVFRGKNILAFGILVAVFAASVGITALDPMGITRYVPETQQITQVNIATSHYFYDIKRNSLALTDPADIAEITQLHQACIDNPQEEDYTKFPLYISYRLANGSTVERYYYVNHDGEAADIVRSYFSKVSAVFRGYSPATLLSNLRMIEVYSYATDMPVIAIATNQDYLDIDFYTDKYGDTGDCISYLTENPAADPVLTGLFEAMEADCLAGNMAQIDYNDLYANIVIRHWTGLESSSIDINIFDTCENTIAYLKSLKAE